MNATQRPGRLVVAVVTVALGLFLAAQQPASAVGKAPPPQPPPSAGDTGSGYQATARVKFSGDAAPNGSRVRRVTVPVICWWGPAPGSYTDPEQMLQAYDSGTLAAQTYTRFAGRSWSPIVDQAHAVAMSRADFLTAAEDAANGARLAWYVAQCRDSATLAEYQDFLHQCPLGMVFNTYPVGDTPQPQVEPQALAQVAREYMNLALPQVERNPKVTAAGGATLVGLPTWFWVTDPVAVGAPAGERMIRAEVGTVYAEVVATTTGLHVTSPAGSTSCTPRQSVVAWRQGTPESSACTLVFTKASVGYPQGYPVQALTTWTATWTGSGNTSGTLAPLTRAVTVSVPVAEVQTIVTR